MALRCSQMGLSTLKFTLAVPMAILIAGGPIPVGNIRIFILLLVCGILQEKGHECKPFQDSKGCAEKVGGTMQFVQPSGQGGATGNYRRRFFVQMARAEAPTS